MTYVMRLIFRFVNFLSMSRKFHQCQPTVSMHLSSLPMPVVAQIIVTSFITPDDPGDKIFVTGLQLQRRSYTQHDPRKTKQKI